MTAGFSGYIECNTYVPAANATTPYLNVHTTHLQAQRNEATTRPASELPAYSNAVLVAATLHCYSLVYHSRELLCINYLPVALCPHPWRRLR